MTWKDKDPEEDAWAPDPDAWKPDDAVTYQPPPAPDTYQPPVIPTSDAQERFRRLVDLIRDLLQDLDKDRPPPPNFDTPDPEDDDDVE
jgi:hypothetical protein